MPQRAAAAVNRAGEPPRATQGRHAGRCDDVEDRRLGHQPSMTSKSRGTLFRDSVAVLPTFIIPGLVSLASIPILFGLLGSRDYGRWALMYAIGNGVPQLTTSWLEAVTLRFGHRESSVGRGRVLALALVLSGVIGGAMAIVLIPGSSGSMAVVTAALTVAVGAYLVAIARLQSQLRFGTASAIASARAVAGGVASVVAAALVGSAEASIGGLALAFGLCSAAALWTRGEERTEAEWPVTIDGVEQLDPGHAPPRLRPYLRYGLASVVLALALFVLSVADRFILAGLRPLSDVGVYAATYAIVDLVFRLPAAVLLAAVRPRMFRAWDADARGASSLATIQAAVLLAWTTAVLTIALIVVARSVPSLPLVLGIVGPLCVGIGAFGVGSAFGTLLSAMERQGRLAATAVGAAVVNVALNLLLIPSLGILGAALATAIAYVTYLCVNAAGVIDGRASRSVIVAIVVCAVATLLAAMAADASRWPWAPAITLVLLVISAPAVLAAVRSLMFATPI